MMIMNINKIPIYHTYMPLELQEGCQKKTNIKKNFLKKKTISRFTVVQFVTLFCKYTIIPI